MALKAGVERDVEYCGVVNYVAGSLHARVAGVACIASTFHQPRSETSDESETARAELALPVPQAINPDRGWPGCAQAQAVASLSRFQKLGSLGSLRSFSNGSCIFSGESTNFVATIASVGKIFLMILAVEVFGLALVGAIARRQSGNAALACGKRQKATGGYSSDLRAIWLLRERTCLYTFRNAVEGLTFVARFAGR